MNLINYFLMVGMLSFILSLIFDHVMFPIMSIFSFGIALGANWKPVISRYSYD